MDPTAEQPAQQPTQHGIGRETTPVVVQGPDGDLAGEQATGPLHAVPAGLADLEAATSLCNHAVRVMGGDPFDPADPDACPVCVERVDQERGSPR